jgi:[ribosomal protein S5]-alanine N-acetyltransferase
MAYTWPVRLESGDLLLRPLARRDRVVFTRLRAANRDWLRPWDATSPNGPTGREDFDRLRRWTGAEARKGRMVPFAIEYRGQLVGQVTAGPIQWGAARSAAVGYWVAQEAAGRGIAPGAVALLADYCFREVGLHRLEAGIRPENARSLAVVRKLRFRYEGLRRAYLFIDGDWRDHESFALLAEDAPDGVVAALRASVPPGRCPV